MEVAVLPSEPTAALSEALILAGATVQPVDLPELDAAATPDWTLLVVELGDEPTRRLRAARRLAEEYGVPVLLVTEREQASLLEGDSWVHDFIVAPPDPMELKLRLGRLAAGAGSDEVLRFKDLELNTATYQAALASRPLDLTFMEYELLRFFVENQGRVWSREQLLSKVWGYDYYGGARTVDVHVRRLRAKLGEERARWITTVRSVGYRFG